MHITPVDARDDLLTREPYDSHPWRREPELPPFEPLPPLGAEPLPIPPQRPRRRKRVWMLYLAFVLLVLTVGWLAITAPLGRALEPLPAPAITLVSADGVPIARTGATKLAPVEVGKLPAHVPAAFIAIEDRRFRSHIGVDPLGIGRAMLVNLRAGGVKEGGSTITQQLAKTAFLTNDRSMARKGRELLIALWLEAWLSKDEVLGRYLSSIYYGDGQYGLRAAARHYFGREPEALTKAQAAMLAAVVVAPSRLAPSANKAGAAKRMRLVAQAMARDGVISRREAAAMLAPRVLKRRRGLPTGTYFADWVLPRARAATGAHYGEKRVGTTLDAYLQRLAVRAVSRARLNGAQAALVAMRPDGQVVAMVGGTSYKTSPFNRATQAKRQPGSTFKLAVYLAALRDGMTPDSRVLDAPITVDGWSPRNSDGRHRGEMTLREAFARSSNAAAVRLQERVGRDAVRDAARDLGIRSPLTPGPSLALGTSLSTLTEMTAAYARVAGAGGPVEVRGLAVGEERAWYELARGSGVGGRERAMLRDLLSAVVAGGTGSAARVGRSFGKTGTAQDGRDALFIGWAGDLVVGVWMGRDDNGPMPGVTGGGAPARLWRDFVASARPNDRAGDRAAPEAERAVDAVREVERAVREGEAVADRIRGWIG